MKNNQFYVPGMNNIMLVVPHGHIKPGYKDDEHTAEIAKLVAENLKCHAVINTVYRKPREIEDPETKEKEWEAPSIPDKIINLNRLTQYQDTSLYKEFVQPIIDIAESSLKNEERFYVFHIHGGSTDLFMAACKEVHPNAPKEVDILIGTGRGGSSKEGDKTITAPPEDLEAFITALKNKGFLAYTTTHPEYAAKATHNLNQLFRGKHRDEGVISFQLEICQDARRDNKKNAEATADKLASAIADFTGVALQTEAELILPEDDKKIDDAVAHILDVYQEAANSAINSMEKVGKYLVERFFDDYESAKNPRNINDNKSLRQIQKRLKNQIGSPSKTWVYDALKVTVDTYFLIEVGSFQTYRNLSRSHRVKLTAIESLEEKKKLAELVDKHGWSVRDLAKELNARKRKNAPLFERLKNDLSDPAKFIANYQEEKLKECVNAITAEEKDKLKQKAEKRLNKIEEQAKLLERAKKQYQLLVDME